MTLVTLKISKSEKLIIYKDPPIMYQCQFGQKLVQRIECRQGFFIELYEPGGLEN